MNTSTINSFDTINHTAHVLRIARTCGMFGGKTLSDGIYRLAGAKPLHNRLVPIEEQGIEDSPAVDTLTFEHLDLGSKVVLAYAGSVLIFASLTATDTPRARRFAIALSADERDVSATAIGNYATNSTSSRTR
jgi:hypothetical protein